ncbi:MAG: type I-U CRISPR-associated protein Csb2 [Arachnia sp.]
MPTPEMGFGLSARWPLGSYLGHRADGTAELLPSFGRVFSSLVHAASVGTCAARDDEGARGFPAMTDASVAVLRWLEEHPPHGVAVPPYPEVQGPPTSTRVIAWRKEGVFDKEVSFRGRVTARAFAERTSVSRPLSWIWSESPPSGILDHLDALCADVGSLGEAESVVVLEVHRNVDSDACTHRLEKASFFETSGEPVDVPESGRLDALELQFREANPVKPPHARYDSHKYGPAGLPRANTPTRAGLTTRLLVPVDAVEAAVPWPTAVALPIQQGPAVGPEDRVGVARDLHRALVAVIGQDCPPVVTGHYVEGAARPTNRVALHYVPPGAPLATGNRAPHLLALIPGGTPAEEVDAILSGLGRIKKLRTTLGAFMLDRMDLRGGREFWAPPAAGTHREWKTDPVAIPERQGSAPTREELLAQAAAWALGNVLRGLDEQAGSRDPRHRLAWLRSRGGEVLEAESYFTPRPARFVHRTNRSMPIMPYVARLALGDLLPSQAVIAIGQSRHLGGGLLVPVDRRARSIYA